MANYFLRNGIFWVSFYKGGKRFRHSLKTNDEKIAKYKTNEIENKVARGDSPLFDDHIQPLVLLEQYFHNNIGIKAEKTRRNEYGTLKLFLQAVNAPSLKQITPELIKKYLDYKINNDKISHVTANNIIKYINTFMVFAVDKRYLARVPKVVAFRVDSKPPKYLNEAEIGQILRAAKDETLYPAILTALCTGMRLGEIRRLKHEDIDWRNKVIIIKVSKSGKYRMVPMRPELEGVLTKENLPFNFTNHLRVFRRIRKKAKVTGVGWHTFRHTFITYLVRDSKDIAAAKEIAGHSKIETTMIYTHVSKEQTQKAVNHINFGVTKIVSEINEHNRTQQDKTMISNLVSSDGIRHI